MRKYMDWKKVEEIAKVNPTAVIYAGIKEDMSGTAVVVYSNGKKFKGLLNARGHYGKFEGHNDETPFLMVLNDMIPTFVDDCWIAEGSTRYYEDVRDAVSEGKRRDCWAWGVEG